MKGDRMTQTQTDAIQQWARLHGRRWKSALRNAWMTGNYEGFEASNELQQLRNSLGPAWLIKFRLGGAD